MFNRLFSRGGYKKIETDEKKADREPVFGKIDQDTSNLIKERKSKLLEPVKIHDKVSTLLTNPDFTKPKKINDTEYFSDTSVSANDKLGQIKGMLMTNKKNIFPAIRTLLMDILNDSQRPVFEKLRIIDDFACSPNGCMLRDTTQFIYDTSMELYLMLYQSDINLTYKMHALKYILRSDFSDDIKTSALKELKDITISLQSDLTSNQLADIYDLLVHTPYESAKNLAVDILEVIRYRDEQKNVDKNTIDYQLSNRLKTVYSDSQNVHNPIIENSINNAIDEIKDAIHVEENKDGLIEVLTAVDCVEQILNALSERGILTDAIRKSLNRICVDTSVFTKFNYRIRDILQKVWLRIAYDMEPETKENAILALGRELTESADWCSSGFVSRILNILSQFDEEMGGLNAVRITWEEQIKANINARLTKRIKDADKEGEIVMSMIDPKNRSVYTTFLDSVKQDICGELLAEFRPVFGKELPGMPLFSLAEFGRIFSEIYISLYKVNE